MPGSQSRMAPLPDGAVDMPRHTARGRASTFENMVSSCLNQYAFCELKSHVSTPTDSANNSQSTSPLRDCIPEGRSFVPSVAACLNSILTTAVPIPNLKKDAARLKERLRLCQLNTLLTHCQVLQTIANKLEHQTLTKKHEKLAQRYYTKMEGQACRARIVTKILQSSEHQARCEYWAGRAYGGMRDYKRAMEHFRLAMDIDVHGHGSRREGTQPRGLTWEENNDVRFLLASVTKRYENRQAKTDSSAAQLIAEVEAERTGRSIEDCIEWDHNSPMWCPEQERVVLRAKRDFEDRGEQVRSVECPGASQKKRSKTVMDRREAIRKTLNKEEWWYIKHGDVPFRRRMRKIRVTRAARLMPCQSSGVNTPELMSGSSDESESGVDEEIYSPLRGRLCSLAQELECLDDWKGHGTPMSITSPGEVIKGDDDKLAPIGTSKMPTVVSVMSL